MAYKTLLLKDDQESVINPIPKTIGSSFSVVLKV